MLLYEKVFLFLSVVKMGVLLTCSTTSAASEGRQCVPATHSVENGWDEVPENL